MENIRILVHNESCSPLLEKLNRRKNIKFSNTRELMIHHAGTEKWYTLYTTIEYRLYGAIYEEFL